MKMNNRDLEVILEHYSHREFAITNSYPDGNKVQHYALKFNDRGTDYQDEYISVHLYYPVLDDIVVVEDMR